MKKNKCQNLANSTLFASKSHEPAISLVAEKQRTNQMSPFQNLILLEKCIFGLSGSDANDTQYKLGLCK